MVTEASVDVSDAEARPTDTDSEIAETGTQPDLVWDNEVPGLCIRIHGNGEKSFIFLYRRDNRQRFLRIGTTPRWSMVGARSWANELRSAVDRTHDPEHYNREREEITDRERQNGPVAALMQLITADKQTEP